ncbi:MAG: hypothetical protein E7813_17210 [Bradyrhizobium sp.]|uniref:hypothetical protein n=1 Tax=Bradyrhizobium sp. TaxID=376 RepID=UPI001201332D|nr:hypothetical protein [Bradyrhizobium sp.]THD63977.1 MAG: hypothetical protein E7813_17210 [Bradyrhizobium sp.]
MHGSFDRSGEPDNRTHQRWNVAVFAIPALVAAALAGLMLTQPSASLWISEAAQAEFVGFNPPPAMASTQIAQPAAPVRAVKAVN